MFCDACRSAMDERDKFCAACGARALQKRCDSCGKSNRPESSFCAYCGDSLRVTINGGGGVAEDVQASSEPKAELKFVTILRADIVGSTAIVADLDPEHAVSRLEPALSAMRAAVRQFRGTVSKELGDGLVAAFGAPSADDNHSRLACHAAIELIRRVAELGDPSIQVRVGLHSAYVLAYVVSSDVSHVYEFGGSAQHLAERLQAVAPPGQIVASEACRLLSEGFIDFETMEPRLLKGFANPIPMYRVVAVHQLSTWQVRKARSIGRFVGRDSEMRSLRAVADGIAKDGKMVSVLGDPGIGKSRLVYEFVEELRAAGWRVIEAECSPPLQASPFAVLKNVLQSALSPHLRVGKPIPGEDPLAGLPPIWHAAIDAVLDLPVSDPDWSKLEPRQRGRAIAEASRAVIERITQDSRVLLLIEDLHWIDSASAAPIESLESLTARHPLLIVTTSRPTGTPELRSRRSSVSLWLRPLDDDAGREMLDDILGHSPSVTDLKDRILRHTGNVPLFIEEVCRGLSDQVVLGGHHDSVSVDISPDRLGMPATIQGMIAARIDRLSWDEKILLRTAAAVGTQATARILQEVTGLPDEQLQSQLAALDRAELLIEVSLLPSHVYEFPHELIRQEAYESMLEAAREKLHRRILASIEAGASGRPDDQSDVLLYHATGAKDWRKSALFARNIARKCIDRSALAEGAQYFGIAIDALDKAPLSAERETLAIDLRIESRVAFSSFGVVDKWLSLAKEADARAAAIGDHARKVATMAVRAAALNFYGAPVEAIEAGEEAVGRAEQLGDRGWLSYAEFGLGQAYFVAGRCREAEKMFARACQQLTGPDPRAPLGNTPQGLAILCYMMWAVVLSMLGDWDQAEVVQGHARAIADRTGRPIDRVSVGYCSGSILLNRGDFAGARAELEKALKLAKEHETKLYIPILACLCGMANLELGLIDEAKTVLTEARDQAHAVGHSSVMLRAPNYLALAQNASADALENVRSVRAGARQQGYEGLEAETWLSEGRMFAMRPEADPEQISQCLLNCIAIAERLEHKPLVAKAEGLLAKVNGESVRH
ncbi:AAA family ATPase [Bradyrhizobium sp. AUGA SZCCT0240]|uniref:AAA family ATPase n=1 Tax=Bradyrhizobium sp. AUGA SZCCT0240 TaxID=2807669 RepID=UPI0024C0AD98|nr:AAA family ATPase [Bradyrhizobium sp. AUGA SZCCT0240]